MSVSALALVPGLPRVQLVPELVLLLVLPPLIYSAGVAMSWREFRFNLRPIALLAIGCVLFTTAPGAECGEHTGASKVHRQVKLARRLFAKAAAAAPARASKLV